MRTAIITLVGIALLSGCAGKPTPANIAGGCYRFDDGTPLFRIAGRTGTFVNTSGLKSFDIGSWKSDGREVEVTPAFVLHDGTNSAPAGRDRMAVTVTTLPSGILRYRQVNGHSILSIPIEAYGWADVQLGKAC